MDERKKKAISIGEEDFKRIIDKNGYLVDKTLLIKELLDSTAKVTLFTRPRRFGKTLNQSMLQRFFEDERTAEGTVVDNRYLFEGLNIMDCGEEYLQHQLRYPVIKLSLKSAKQPDFKEAYLKLREEIADEFRRHKYVLNGTCLDEDQKKLFQKLMERQGEYGEYNSSVKFLSSCLKAFHKREVIILIDEYDVPLETAYYSGFYDEMVSFIRSLFESALKGNDSLNFAVVTGCLKINRESIFTGLNHLDAVSVTTPRYNEAFGFTEEEVKKILSYYDRSEKFGQVKDWYDGYLFGGKEIYNPWSILKFMQDSTASPAHEPQAYWVNTSSNQIVRDLVDHATSAVRREIEILMSGGTIEKVIDENITYGNLHQSEDNLWSMLYFTGYLKDCGRSQQNPDAVKLCIPNREVAGVYKTVITSWFDEKIRNENLDTLQTALEEGDCPAITGIISNLLLETISYYDYSENYYHGFLTGLLTKMGKYTLTSNREAGSGRADLLLREERLYGRAMILELKVADDVRKMEGKCEEALRQIESQDYDTELAKDGCQPILKYGICFYKKGCLVKKAESK